MVLKVIQPWGYPPAPLVPKSIIQIAGSLDAPSSLKKILGKQATLAELDSGVWKHIEFVNRTCLSEIVDVLRPHFADFNHLSIYMGKSVPQLLQSLPFSVRTRNAISKHIDLFTAPQLNFSDILDVPSFGVRSAIEFACIVEAAVTETESVEVSEVKPKLLGVKNFVPESEIGLFFQTLAAWASGEHSLDKLEDVLPMPLDQWPPEIRLLWSRLGDVKTIDIAGEYTKYYSIPKLITQFLDLMNDRSINLVRERILKKEHPVTLEELGERYNISRQRVQQIEQQVLSRLEELRGAKFQPVLRRAASLRDRLGSAVPKNHHFVKDELAWVVRDFGDKDIMEKSLAQELMLWLAGPYKSWRDWLIVDGTLPERTTKAFLECQNERGVISHDLMAETLNGLGIKEEHHQTWIEDLQKFLLVTEGFIHFHGGMLDKARALIQYHDRPMTVEEMFNFIGGSSVRSMRQRLIEDPRFWRINKQNEFVIAGTPGYDEYTGITDEIIQEIESCGGQAPYRHLVDKITSVYGVKEISVIAYLNTPVFIKDKNGMVSVRNLTDDPGVVSADITKTAGCYRTDNDTWFWRVKIDSEIMRGSGRSVPNAFAYQLGCDIGNKINVLTEYGDITLNWSLSSTYGASIGSLRHVVTCFDAEIGDYLFINSTSPAITEVDPNVETVFLFS